MDYFLPRSQQTFRPTAIPVNMENFTAGIPLTLLPFLLLVLPFLSLAQALVCNRRIELCRLPLLPPPFPSFPLLSPPSSFLLLSSLLLTHNTVIPGDGNAPTTCTLGDEIGEVIAFLMEVPKWDKFTFISGDTFTWNHAVQLAEKYTGTSSSPPLLSPPLYSLPL